MGVFGAVFGVQFFSFSFRNRGRAGTGGKDEEMMINRPKFADDEEEPAFAQDFREAGKNQMLHT